VFFEYGKLVAQTAKEFGIVFRDDGVVLKPQIREVVFGDTADFRLYNSSFILRRRIATKMDSRRVNRKSFSSIAIPTCRGPRSWICGRTFMVFGAGRFILKS